MKKLRKKVSFYRNLLIEIIETLCTICLFLEGQRYRQPYPSHFRSHFEMLKRFSRELKGEEAKEGGDKRCL